MIQGFRENICSWLMLAPAPRGPSTLAYYPVLLEWKRDAVLFSLCYLPLLYILHQTLDNMQKIFKPGITISLIHHSSSFVVPPSPDLQARLPNCALLKKIKVHIAFVCSNSAKVFTCSIRIYLHCSSERFPTNYLQNHRNRLQTPSPFFFYPQNILLNIYVYILKNTEKIFQDSKDFKHL